MATACTADQRGLRKGWRVRGLARLLLGGGLLLGGTWASALAAPPVGKMLEYQPRHESAITTPSQADQAACQVDLIKGKVGSGWVLKDGQGKLLRRFYSSDGRNVDTYSYYRDGVEVYREIVTAGSRAPDQFRWLNAGGSKWGVDEDKNGTIDSWKIISAEEVSQEVLRALATRNVARLEACLISDEEIRLLGLPTDMVEDIQARRKGVKAKFEATIAKLPKLTEKANWLHLETAPPECLPADQTGARADILRHRRGTVLFESGGSSEWFQLGPMIQVGASWRLLDAPTPGTGPASEEKPGTMGLDDPKLQKLVEELTALDKANVGSNGATAVKHHLGRADILEKIIAVVKPADRDPWIRQVADSLSSAVQASPASDTTAATRLATLEKQLVQAMEGSNLAAYVSFRRMQAEYSAKLSSNPKDFNEVQKEWLGKLTEYVKAYPKADDTADAMLQLGMVCEFLGKEVEAKNWYGGLARAFPDKPQAAKGAGAARRLDLEGQAMALAGPVLGSGTDFDISQLRGKVVIVYYWASWNGQAASDLTKIKAVIEANKEAVEVVTVNLDGTAEEARAFLTKNPAPGTHLFQTGALESKLATQYGIMVLPSLFLVGKDGKCISKSIQVSGLEDEVKKAIAPEKAADKK
ncbi:MAG: thioredoxin-like domain-containing protein [Gemmataceae bacterium]